MRSSRAVLDPCTRCASLKPMALTSTPFEQSARLRPSTASCMLVRHGGPGGVMLTKQIGPGSASDWCALQEALYKCIDTIQYNTGLADSCAHYSRLVSLARQARTSTPVVREYTDPMTK